MAPGHFLDALEAPLPVEQGERVLGIRYWSLEDSGPAPATGYDLTVWREALASFEALGAVRETEQNLDPGTGIGQSIHAAVVTASAFAVLRARPLLGRTLDAGDEQPGAPRVVVLGYDAWRARLGGDADVVGRTVRVAGVPHTVVGVMPPDFLFPRNEQVWLPLRDVETRQPGGDNAVLIFGRLARGVTDETAQAELTTVAQRMALDHPDHYVRLRAEVVPFAIAANGWPRGGLRAFPAVRLLQLPALILLLVACVNVGLLILARSATRSAEIAVRTALGAGRMRIVAQMFTEALVLSVLSAGVGVFLFFGLAKPLLDAVWSSDWMSLPYWVDLGFDAETVGWALVLATLSAAAASVVPALRVTGKGVAGNIQRARAAGSGLRFGGKATALVVADLAVAVAVVGAVVGIGEKTRLAFTRGGPTAFPAEHYLAVEVRPPQGSPFAAEGDPVEDEARAARMAILERTLVERLGAEPRVQGIALGSALPGTNHSRRRVE
ncbi:MAG: ABC transporter permease, partial [Haloechinothrix sp.]